MHSKRSVGQSDHRSAAHDVGGQDDGSVRSHRLDVLGVGVSIVSLEGALRTVETWVDHEEHDYVCVTGVHGVMESQRDPDLLRIHNQSGLTVADGIPILWCGRFAGARDLERIRGSDLMLAVCELAARQGWACFFYGGAPGTAELLAARLTARFPGLRVAGTYSPPFRPLTDAENSDVVKRMNESGAQLVWIGLSTPKQERFMADNVGMLNAAALFGVGMAFDVHAGLLAEAPPAIQKSGFEWLYRLLHEPRRLWRRYLLNIPWFLASIVLRKPFVRPEADERSAEDPPRG